MMHGLCSNNALYSANLSFAMFFFWLILILELLLFWMKSQPGVAYESIAYEKHMLFYGLLNMKNKLCYLSLFLCLSCISLGQYCQKKDVKSVGLKKKIWKGDNGHIPSAQTFSTIWVFSKFWHGVRNPYKIVHERVRSFKKYFCWEIQAKTRFVDFTEKFGH